MANAITVLPLYSKKIFFSAFFIFLSFGLCFPSDARAQVAVPVSEVPFSPLYLLTQSISVSSSDSAWNTAQLAAKEVGIGFWTPPGSVAPVTVTGAQVGAQSSLSADSLATIIFKPLIRNMTNSLVQWINNGFEGSPLFVSDPEKFFIGVADRIAGSFIEGSDLAFLCSPFALDIRLALNLNYSARFRDEIGCTLTDVIDNIEGFAEDFEQGGWDGWFSMTQNSQNNPYGAYLSAQSELDIRLLSDLGVEGIQLDWGQGFLGFRDCILSNAETQECMEYGPTKTPGTVINTQLEDALGTDLAQFELADEFDEIVGALVGQLFSQIQQGLINS